MSNWTISFKVDLAQGAPFVQTAGQGLMLPGDDEAHTVVVTVMDNGAPAELSGTPVGFFTRSDGLTVPCSGTLAGNVIRVTMAPECYMTGPLRCVIRLLSSVEDALGMSLVDAQFSVREGTGDAMIDPADVIPSVREQALRLAAVEAGASALTSRVNDLENAPVLEAELTLESAWEHGWGSYTDETLRVLRKGGVVFMQGFVNNKSTIASLGTTAVKVADLPAWAAPARLTEIVGQGTGRSVFLLVVRPASGDDPAFVDVQRYHSDNSGYPEVAAGSMFAMTGAWLAADAAGTVVDDLETLIAQMEAINNNAVRYDGAQELTAEEQAQARANIGASEMTVTEDTDGLVITL